MSDWNSTNNDIIEEFRRNGGKVSGYYEGTSLLLLTTTGRKSGQRRTSALAYSNDRDRLILVAANSGANRNPDWYYNIQAHPEVTIEVGNETLPASASILEGEERERFLVGAPEAWAEAQKEHSWLPNWPQRAVPVIALTVVRHQ